MRRHPLSRAERSRGTASRRRGGVTEEQVVAVIGSSTPDLADKACRTGCRAATKARPRSHQPTRAPPCRLYCSPCTRALRRLTETAGMWMWRPPLWWPARLGDRGTLAGLGPAEPVVHGSEQRVGELLARCTASTNAARAARSSTYSSTRPPVTARCSLPVRLATAVTPCTRTGWSPANRACTATWHSTYRCCVAGMTCSFQPCPTGLPGRGWKPKGDGTRVAGPRGAPGGAAEDDVERPGSPPRHTGRAPTGTTRTTARQRQPIRPTRRRRTTWREHPAFDVVAEPARTDGRRHTLPRPERLRLAARR
jgi:hypothetical protein